MLESPRRISLSSQVAAAIRKRFEDGVWKDFLPGERGDFHSCGADGVGVTGEEKPRSFSIFVGDDDVVPARQDFVPLNGEP